MNELKSFKSDLIGSKIKIYNGKKYTSIEYYVYPTRTMFISKNGLKKIYNMVRKPPFVDALIKSRNAVFRDAIIRLEVKKECADELALQLYKIIRDDHPELAVSSIRDVNEMEMHDLLERIEGTELPNIKRYGYCCTFAALKTFEFAL